MWGKSWIDLRAQKEGWDRSQHRHSCALITSLRETRAGIIGRYFVRSIVYAVRPHRPQLQSAGAGRASGACGVRCTCRTPQSHSTKGGRIGRVRRTSPIAPLRGPLTTVLRHRASKARQCGVPFIVVHYI